MVAITISMFLCLVRLVVGPSIVDRLLALDTLFLNATCLVVILGIYWASSSLFEGALLVAMLGFVSTAALARYFTTGHVRLGETVMQLVMEILVSIFLMIGSFFYVGWWHWYGFRLPDLFMRLHANKIQHLRTGQAFLIAAMIFSAFHGRFGFAEILLTLLAFITAPVSANLMAQAALHLRLRSTSGEVPEALERPPYLGNEPVVARLIKIITTPMMI